MDIRQLRTLVHVAELGSLSRAAERLGVAQPALSRQVRLLEAELGGALFARHGRGMVPTPLGRAVLAEAQGVLDHMAAIRALAGAGATSQALTGKVRFGMTPTVAEIMTVPLTRALRAAHPGLTLQIVAAFSGHLLDWLGRGELDICVAYDPERAPSLRTRPLLVESLLLVGPAEAGLALDKPVAMSALARLPLVLPSPHHGLRRIVDGFARRAGVTLDPAVEADAFGALIDLVREGIGHTVLPLAPVHARIRRGELTAAPLVDPAPVREVVLAWSADRPPGPGPREAGERFVALAQALVAQGIWAGRLPGVTV